MGSIKQDGKRPFEKVLISGAGPAGLLLGLLLAQHGIPSTILESWDRLDERLRATQYGVPATKVFRRAGILDDIRAVGIGDFPYIRWRKVSDHEVLTGINLSVVNTHPDRMTILPLNQIIHIMYRHLTEKYSHLVDIKFNHKVVDVGQDDKKAWADVEVEGQTEKVRFEADYVMGCDGGRSAVRKSLFGRDWPGETFETRLLVQNVWYDGFAKHGWDGGNYMVGGETGIFGLIARRAKGGLWRVTYGDHGDHGDLSEEELLARRPAHFEKLLPGNPKPGEYRIEGTNIFNIHNRCVPKMKVGRVFLAADAAHVCNPFGGYGCMTAVIDIDGLADCLIGYYDGRADEDILEKYAEIRREKFMKFVDARSRKNMNRIAKANPQTVLEDDKFLQLLKGLEGNDEETKAFLLKYSSIEYDFKQLYHS